MSASEERIDRVISKARKLVTPTKRETETLGGIAERIRGRLRDSFNEFQVAPEVRMGGSYAKGTWLPGSGDIDFFLLYPTDYARERLESEAIQGAKGAVRGYETNMRFAEHPYVEAIVEGNRLNLVPCYKVEKGEWQSAADRSPYHTQYIEEHFNDDLRLETRLLKLFAKSIGIYGAEVKVHGFSGYVCEVLTLKFGSFKAVLKHLSTIKRKEIISLEPYDKDLADSFGSPIVLLDPVDSTRNLGTAISARNLAKLILNSRSFLSKPSIAYFRRRKDFLLQGKPRRDRELLQRTIVVSFPIKARSVDILWGQLYRSLDAFANKLELSGFKTLRRKASSNETHAAAFILLLMETKISQFQTRTGPDVFRNEDFAKYLDKNRRRAIISWLDSEGRVISLFQRESGSNDIAKEIKNMLGTKGKLESIGLSKAIKEEIRFRFKIQTGLDAVSRKGESNDWLRSDVYKIVHSEDELS